MRGGLALANQVGDADVKVVRGLALGEKVVLDETDREGLVLLLEVSRDFDSDACEFVSAGASENAVEGVFHLAQEFEGDLEVLGEDFEVVGEAKGGEHAELQDLHGLGG